MTLKEADRLAVMKQIDNKKINLRKASQELGISYRQQIRLWQSYQKEGPKGLISKRRGKPRVMSVFKKRSKSLENIFCFTMRTGLIKDFNIKRQ